MFVLDILIVPTFRSIEVPSDLIVTPLDRLEMGPTEWAIRQKSSVRASATSNRGPKPAPG